VQGSRPKEDVARQASEAEAAPTQAPVAQKQNIDEPVKGSSRATAQDGLAASENVARRAPEVKSAPAQAPIVQKKNIDQPVKGSSRATAQDGIAASENAVRLASQAKSTPAQEPIAQKKDIDEPVDESSRATAQDGLAASENTVAPESGEQKQKPLPDLRYGLPSTFDFEFGNKKEQGKSEEKGQFDVAGLPEGGREKGEREYDASAYETSTDRRRNAMASYGFAAALIVALGGALYLARPYAAEGANVPPAGFDLSNAQSWGPGSMYARVRARMGSQVGYYTEPVFTKLLPDVPAGQGPAYTLVLSLEDLMVHTTWDTKNGYRLAKRPGLDYFIRYLSPYFELVLFTTAPRYMADSVMAKLDPYHFIMWPLGREATRYENGEYIKDLAYLNRDLSKTIIIDTHAPHVKNQPENAIILPKWKGAVDASKDADLVALIPFLEYLATMGTEDVRAVLKSFEGTNIPEEFARREALARAKFNAQMAAERSRKPKFSVGSIAGSLGVSSKGMGGGMTLGDGQSVAEGFAQGKMLSDQIREQGQKQYEALEKQIRENGEQWLKEEKEEQQRLMDQNMKEVKQGALGWFGGSAKQPEEGK
jgi:import inner membrane translocase subunit TIM50